MKLLLDQNLSHKLVPDLAKLFPGTNHVRHLGMATADDQSIWDFAKANGFAIVSKDDDFEDRAHVYGQPPKVVWLSIGNVPASAVRALILADHKIIKDFLTDPHEPLLILP